ncbi:uncharacterized protein LOC141628966 [Silene latifolia]|uniref:uncharacterized protein LOC141628966 n=1 Tax=Silene latifolia TaxID=37657 RepID=UPI003D7741E1
MDGENLYEYWERFKQLLASCPYHGYTDHDLLLNFCGGLLEDDARMIKAATQGGIEYMSVQEANELIERLVGSSRNFGRRIKKSSGTFSSRQGSNHMEEKVDFLTNLVKELTKGGGSTSHVKFCGLCNDPTHPTDGCPSLQTEEAIEVVKAIGFRKFDPYSNTYNEGGSLPSHTIPPPNKEQAKAVSLRNDRELEEAPKAPKKTRPLPIVHEVEDVIEDEIEVVVEQGEASTPQHVRVNEPLPEYEPQAPLPSALNDTRIVDKKTSSLYDIFRASINVLPNYLYESLKLGPLKPTRTVISLADRSNIYPKGVVEDVLVKVGGMLFPADFYVIEMEPEKGSTPILLGRPFMRTSNTKIDVSSGRPTMEFEGEKIEYSIHEAMKYPSETSSLCFLEIFEPIVQTVYELCKVDPLNVVLTNGLVGEDEGGEQHQVGGGGL